MDTAPHYSVSGLVYHPHPSLNHPHPNSIPDSAPPHPSFPQDMSWRPSHHSPDHPQSTQHPHSQIHQMDHVPDYAHPSSQQSFMSRHAPDAYTNHVPSSSVDPGPSSLSFDSPQIDSSIGPDRGIARGRRVRLPDRVPQSHELPEYAAISQSYAVRPLLYTFDLIRPLNPPCMRVASPKPLLIRPSAPARLPPPYSHTAAARLSPAACRSAFHVNAGRLQPSPRQHVPLA